MKINRKFICTTLAVMAASWTLHAQVVYHGDFYSGSGTSRFGSDGGLNLGATGLIGSGNMAATGTGTFGGNLRVGGSLNFWNAASGAISADGGKWFSDGFGDLLAGGFAAPGRAPELGGTSNGFYFRSTGFPGFYWDGTTSVSIQRLDGTGLNFTASGTVSGLTGLNDGAVTSAPLLGTTSQGTLISVPTLPPSVLPPYVLTNNWATFITNGATITTGYTNGVTSWTSSNEFWWRTNVVVAGTVYSSTNTFWVTNTGSIFYEIKVNQSDLQVPGNYCATYEVGNVYGTALNGITTAPLNNLCSSVNTYATPTYTTVAGGFYISCPTVGTDTQHVTIEIHCIMNGTNTIVNAKYPMG